MATDGVNKWAVLVGIDFYKEPDHPGRRDRRPTNLNGCVADVTEVEKVLKTQYSVSPKRIFKLIAPVPRAASIPKAPVAGTSAHNRASPSKSPVSKAPWLPASPGPSVPRKIPEKRPSRPISSRPNKGRVESLNLSPTYENIIDTFNNVTEKANANDFVYIHYSGHGRRVRTIFPKLKVDYTNQPDETLVPTDIATTKGRYLRDVELHYIFQRMVQRGLKVFIVLDCCHSGGATRMFQPKMALRGIVEYDDTVYKSDVSLLPADELIAVWPSSQRPKEYTCLAACGESDPACENEEDGTVYGALTHSFLCLLKEGKVLNSQTFYDYIEVPVRRRCPSQRPLLTGPNNTAFFGAEDTHSFRIPTVTTDCPLSEYKEISIDAGDAHGIWRNMMFAIYPGNLGQKEFESWENRLAYAKVIRVEQDTSKLKIQRILKTQNDLNHGYRAVFLSMATGNKKRIRIGSMSSEKPSSALQTIKQLLQLHRGGLFEIAEPEETADMEIVVDDRGYYGMRDRDEEVPCVLDSLPTHDPTSSEQLVRRIIHYTKFSIIRDLKPVSDTFIKGELKVELGCDNGEWSALDRVYNARDGQDIALRVTNGTDHALHITVMNLAPSWTITQLYPFRTTEYHKFVCGEHRQIEVGMELPENAHRLTRCQDIIRVFATTERANFQWMELSKLGNPTYRGEPQPCLGELKEVNAAMNKERDVHRKASVECPWFVKDFIIFTTR